MSRLNTDRWSPNDEKPDSNTRNNQWQNNATNIIVSEKMMLPMETKNLYILFEFCFDFFQVDRG